MFHNFNPRAGFTKWEAIAIVLTLLVLAAFLFPACACRSPDSACRASCQSNERQIAFVDGHVGRIASALSKVRAKPRFNVKKGGRNPPVPTCVAKTGHKPSHVTTFQK